MSIVAPAVHTTPTGPPATYFKSNGDRGLPGNVHRMARLYFSCFGHTVALALAHAAAFAAIYLSAYVLRGDGAVSPELWEVAWRTLPLVAFVKVACFLVVGCQRGCWRSATLADLTKLFEALTFGSLVIIAGRQFAQTGVAIPRSVLLIDWACSIVFICGVRGVGRIVRERYCPFFSARRPQRVLVVGSGAAAEAVVCQLASQPQLGMKVVGLIDPDRTSLGRTIAGVRVVGRPSDLTRIASRQHLDAVLIPTPAVPAREVRALLDFCRAAEVKVQVVPQLDAILTGAISVRPRKVDIADLLARDPVRLDGAAVGHFLDGRVVLITGAAGSIGSEICRQVLRYHPKRLLLVDHNENGLFFIERELRSLAPPGTEIVPCVASITDAARLRVLFQAFRPEVVFHAAAHKHVPMMEANPGEAVKNNVFGTKNLVDESVRSGVESFVMVSTDKAVRPTSVMGACKRLAELYAQSQIGRSNTRMVTVRFGNVLGSNGSVVPVFLEQIRGGGPVTVTHPEMTRYFMTIREAAQLVLQSGAQGRGGEIFVLDMGDPVRIVDLARELIRLSRRPDDPVVEIVFTGLRPGEKLHERLFDEEEKLLPTPHPKIQGVEHVTYPFERILGGLERLAGLVNGPSEPILKALIELVPHYRPNLTGGGYYAGCVEGSVVNPISAATAQGRQPRPTLRRGRKPSWYSRFSHFEAAR